MTSTFCLAAGGTANIATRRQATATDPAVTDPARIRRRRRSDNPRRTTASKIWSGWRSALGDESPFGAVN
ncbi:MAG: hypothetical protein ACRDQZ_23210 [Mycobacteriales bacterium]